MNIDKLEDASVRLAGVCELLECAANASTNPRFRNERGLIRESRNRA